MSSSSSINISKNGNRRPRNQKKTQLNEIEVNNKPYFSVRKLPSFAVYVGGMDAAPLCRALGADIIKFYSKEDNHDA